MKSNKRNNIKQKVKNTGNGIKSFKKSIKD